APKVFAKVSKQGVPTSAVIFSSILIFGCVLLNYFIPEEALSYLMYMAVAALVLNWAIISFTHLKFKRSMKLENKVAKFP
ncbi:amino acid permease, partial [Acinetobacter baumannii]